MLYNDDCLNVLNEIKTNSIDLIFADPPYFLSNGGKTIHSGKVVSVNKGVWDDKSQYEDHLEFTKTWLKLCYEVLKYDGSIFVSGTIHNIFDVKKYLDELNFKIINIIIWHKPDPPPLIYKNKLKFSYEFIIWASKNKVHKFNYEEAFKYDNKEMEDVWTINAVKMNEKRFGYHPTQKPEALLERIIKICTKPNDLILDPFMGSGTTCYVAKKLDRRYIGIEKDYNYFVIAKKRLESI